MFFVNLPVNLKWLTFENIFKKNMNICIGENGCRCQILIPVPGYRSKNKRKNIEEQNLIDNDFQSLKLQQTGFINMGADGSLFPKARTGPPRSVQPQNPYANQRGLPFPDY